MKCGDCINLDENDKKCGVCGAKYYCKKQEKYVDGSCGICDQFGKSYCRTNYKKDEIIKDGYNYSEDNISVGAYRTIFIIILIISSLYTVIDKFTII